MSESFDALVVGAGPTGLACGIELQQRGIDVTLICESPKIGPYRDAMRARIAEIAGLDIGRVGVKATTSERLGFTGRGEGIACLASATLRLPWRDRP